MELNDIKSLIAQDQTLKQAQNRYLGRFYYNYQPNTGTRDENVVLVGNQVITKKAKDQVYINYFKKLVNQKINYLLTNPLVYDQRVLELGFDMNELLDSLILNASLDSRSWLYLYVFDNKLLFSIISDAQIIPMYDKTGNIEELIRYYPEEDSIKVEIWTDSQVFMLEYKDETILKQEVLPHYTTSTIYQNEVEEERPKSLGFIPFIPLYNNKELTGDVHDIASIIKLYNSICTGLIDNINEFQEAITKFKNYVGSTEQLQDIMQQMKLTKAIGVPSDGDVEYIRVEIPTEPRQMILDLLRKAMYSIASGFDQEDFVSANNTTNVMIKAKYADLDAKASDTIRRVRAFYRQLVDRLNKFYGGGIKTDLEFAKAQVFNVTEVIEDCVNCIPLVEAGLMSKKTLMSNHPWIDSVDEELKQIDKEKQNKPIL
jgi:SPP1 family phage portal protein